jgi:hypothetical protein
MNRTLRLALVACVGTVVAASTAIAQPVREGEGSRREQLNARELKPFASDAWSTLSDAKIGKLVNGNDNAGKPVLIVTWTSWLPTGDRALNVAKKAAETYGKDGLIVVVAHHPEGWNDPKAQGSTIKLAAGANLVLAHDAKGEFRKAIQSDQDPDFYIIDRAGQLRFADVTTESVDEACRIVSAETLDQASNINKQLAADATKRAQDAAKTSAIRDSVSLVQIPEQPFAEPGAAAYDAVRWPKNPDEKEETGGAKPAARKVALPEVGYLPSKPNTKGRGIVVYFWSPNIRETYDPVMTQMDQLQRKLGRDVVVVGILSPITMRNSSGEPPKLKDDALAFARGRNLQHAVLADPASNISKQVSGEGERIIPFGAIMSSDGTVRFAGPLDHPAFLGVLDAIVRDDPGVKARRDAETKYLKANGG